MKRSNRLAVVYSVMFLFALAIGNWQAGGTVGQLIGDEEAATRRGGCIGAYSYWCGKGACPDCTAYCASGEDDAITNPAGNRNCGGTAQTGCGSYFGRQELCYE